jgi:predicted Fe-S protein YdhL (DUF1289 family)
MANIFSTLTLDRGVWSLSQPRRRRSIFDAMTQRKNKRPNRQSNRSHFTDPSVDVSQLVIKQNA